ncbi:MAG: hypothetical protein AAGF83_27835 [Cyanobacteria bacterium P01_G01_bin.67]
MNNQAQVKISWRAALGALTLTWGAFSIMEAPAKASEPEDLVIAQVGVRSRVTSPTPLNLRPRTHTPLPTREYSQKYDYYGNPIYENSRRGHRRFRRSSRRRRGFGHRGRFGRHGGFGGFGHGDRHHRRSNRFRGRHNRRHFDDFGHRRNRGKFGRGIIIKKKF